jgi:hypothetical protein
VKLIIEDNAKKRAVVIQLKVEVVDVSLTVDAIYV